MITLKDIFQFLVSSKLQVYLIPLKIVFIGVSLYFLFYWFYFSQNSKPLIKNQLSPSFSEVLLAYWKAFWEYWRSKIEGIRKRRERARTHLLFLEGMDVLERWVEKIPEGKLPGSYQRDLAFLREIKKKILEDQKYSLEGEEKEKAFQTLSFLLEEFPKLLPSLQK